MLGQARVEVRRLGTKDGGKRAVVAMEGILQRCSLELDATTRTASPAELSLHCRAGHRALLHRVAHASMAREVEEAAVSGEGSPEDVTTTAEWSGSVHPMFKELVGAMQAQLQVFRLLRLPLIMIPPRL